MKNKKYIYCLIIIITTIFNDNNFTTLFYTTGEHSPNVTTVDFLLPLYFSVVLSLRSFSTEFPSAETKKGANYFLFFWINVKLSD